MHVHMWGCVSVEKNSRVKREGFACYTQHAFNLRLVCTVAIAILIHCITICNHSQSTRVKDGE